MSTHLRWLSVCTVCAAGLSFAAEVGDGADPNEVRDPFTYERSREGRGTVPATDRQLPHGIRLLAVLVPEEGEPIAVLRIPGNKTPTYVRQGELVAVSPGEATEDAAGEQASPFYLLVKSIREVGVEVAPRVSPDEVHLIQ
jgi:hypothetical protein